MSSFEWPLKTGFTVYADVVAVLAIKVVSYFIPQKEDETPQGIFGIGGMHFNQGNKTTRALGGGTIEHGQYLRIGNIRKYNDLGGNMEISKG